MSRGKKKFENLVTIQIFWSPENGGSVFFFLGGGAFALALACACYRSLLSAHNHTVCSKYLQARHRILGKGEFKREFKCYDLLSSIHKKARQVVNTTG